METLDRRISASSDQLDTLRREKKHVWVESDDLGRHSRHGRHSSRPATSASHHSKRPRSAMRHNHPELDKTEKVPLEDDDNEVTIDYRGEKISKSRYFFGDILNKSSGPSSGTSSNNNGSNNGRPKSRLGFLKEDRNNKHRKTAVDIFLEDSGPYSRKLYGPPPPTKESAKDKSPAKNNNSSNNNNNVNNNTKRARSQEIIIEVSHTYFNWWWSIVVSTGTS